MSSKENMKRAEGELTFKVLFEFEENSYSAEVEWSDLAIQTKKGKEFPKNKEEEKFLEAINRECELIISILVSIIQGDHESLMEIMQPILEGILKERNYKIKNNEGEDVDLDLDPYEIN